LVYGFDEIERIKSLVDAGERHCQTQRRCQDESVVPSYFPPSEDANREAHEYGKNGEPEKESSCDLMFLLVLNLSASTGSAYHEWYFVDSTSMLDGILSARHVLRGWQLRWINRHDRREALVG